MQLRPFALSISTLLILAFSGGAQASPITVSYACQSNHSLVKATYDFKGDAPVSAKVTYKKRTMVLPFVNNKEDDTLNRFTNGKYEWVTDKFTKSTVEGAAGNMLNFKNNILAKYCK